MASAQFSLEVGYGCARLDHNRQIVWFPGD